MKEADLIIPSETVLKQADDLVMGLILMHGAYPTNSK
jgi:hypothetical protein